MATKLWQTASQLEGTIRERMSGRFCKEDGVTGAGEEHLEEVQTEAGSQVLQGPVGNCEDSGFCSV